MGSPVLTSSSFLHSCFYCWGGRQVRYKAGVFAGFNPAKGEKWEDASDDLCLCVWVYGYLKAMDVARIVLLMYICAFLCACMNEWIHRQWQKVTPVSVVYYVRFICQAGLHWLSVLLPDCVSWTVLSLMECFLPLKPSWTEKQGELYNRLSDRFSKQAGHEYASSSTNSQEKKLLDVAESENKQFCHIQAAALTLSAHFSESLTVSSILLLQHKRVSCPFHH